MPDLSRYYAAACQTDLPCPRTRDEIAGRRTAHPRKASLGRFITFSEMTLEREELDSLIEEAGEMNFPDEEASELVEAQWLRKYSGMLGYIQLGFVYQGLIFLHETTTEWYERYQALLEDIESFHDIVIDDHHEHDED